MRPNYKDLEANLAALQRRQRQQEDRLRLKASALARISDAVIAIDANDKVTYWNEAAHRMYGLTREEAIGRKLSDCFETRWVEPDHDRAFRSALAADGWWQGEAIHITRSGHRIHTDSSIGVLTDSESRPIGMLAVIRDVSAKKQADQALRESEERYRTLFTSMSEGFGLAEILRDGAGRPQDYRLLEVNPAFGQLMGITAEGASGRTARELFGDIDPRWLEAFAQVAATGEPVSFEGYLKRSNKWFQVYVFATGENRLGHLLIDVTERKLIVDALNRSREDLEQRVRERTAELAASNAELQRRSEQLGHLASQLTLAEQRERRRLARILHDHLQQLLVSAEFSLEVLSRRVQDDLQPAVVRMKSLLDEAIAASRSLTVELSPPILHEAGLAAGFEWLARWMQDKHRLDVDLDADPKAVIEREDVKVLVFEAARELLFNVVKHSGVLRARLALRCEGEGGVRVVVSDAGLGFDPERMWKEASLKEGGFGLFSIRERLGLLGCRMKVESAPGRGATFTLLAPRAVDSVLPVPASVRQSESGNGRGLPVSRDSDFGEQQGSALRVLLADDHAVMRQGLQLLLKEEAGIEVVGEAADGEDAVAMARMMRPDVIVMDLGMPRMNGLEATRVIHSEFPEIRIIGLSMFEEAHWAMAMIKAGATAHFTKSGEPEALLAAIRGLRVAT